MTAATSAGSRPRRAASVRMLWAWSSGYQSRAYQAGIDRCTAYQAPPRAQRTSRTTATRRRRRTTRGSARRRVTGHARVLAEALGDPFPERLQRAVVEEPPIRPRALGRLRQLAVAALGEPLPAALDPRAPHLVARAYHQHGVELALAPGLEEERDLADQQPRRGLAPALLLAPCPPSGTDQGVQQALQEGDAVRRAEGQAAERPAVEQPVAADHGGAEALDHGVDHPPVPVEVVDDVVAREDRRPAAGEGGERLRFSRADPSGERHAG